MKRIYLLLFLFCVPLLVMSQKEMTRGEEPAKGFLSMSFGPSLVTGEFAKTDFNDTAGFAKNGYCYTILEFGYKFIPNFGIAASLRGGVIPQDVQALADGYASEYGGQFTVTSTRWGYTGFFAGPFFCIPTKVVDFDIRLLTGLLIAESPEVVVSRAPEAIYQESAYGGSLALQMGAGARIHISKKFGLITFAEYHISNPTFDIEYHDHLNNYEYQRGSRKFTTFNFTFGLVYRIF